MFSTVCPVCKNEFYSEDSFNNSAMHNDCAQNEQPKEKIVRTSTPIAELENTPASSFSDSVTDFFYQSWKSGLCSKDNTPDQRPFEPYYHRPQPVCYTPQVVYFNTVVYQAFTQYPYVQQVGYRPDGTFGVLPTYWGYFGN